MLHHYFITAFRQFFRNPLFSFINMMGLAIGMAACLLIGQYVSYELSYDEFYSEKDNLYRVWMERYQSGELQTSEARTYPALGEVLEKEIAGVKKSLRTTTYRGSLLNYQIGGNEWKAFPASRICTAEPQILDMLSIKVLEGNTKTALERPFTMMICESYAKAYFPNQNPLGKIIKEDGEEDFEITGVFADLPKNSSLQFQFIKSYSSLAQHFQLLTGRETNVPTHSWDWPRIETFVQLIPDANVEDIEFLLNESLLSHKSENQIKQIEEKLYLQPIDEMHLYSERNQRYGSDNGQAQKLGFSLIIATLILLLAWINYVNLSTAKATMRAKEVGVRKTLGAVRTMLIKQFLFESFAINLFAAILAFTIFQLSLNTFNSYFNIGNDYSLLSHWQIWLITYLVFVFGAFISGLYPAWMLSSFRISHSVKGTLPLFQTIPLRKALAILQFATTFILLTGTFGVYLQLKFMQEQDLGMNLEQIMIVKGPRAFDYEQFSANPNIVKQAWKNIPDVSKVSSSYSVPANGMSAYEVHRLDQPERSKRIYSHEVDHHFVDVYEINLIAGRNFSGEFASDDSAVLINQSALHQFGFTSPEAAIGQKISTPEEGYTRHIIGVVKDFHHQSLHHMPWPITLSLDTESRGFYSLKLQTEDLTSSIADIQAVFEEVFPGNVFEYFFADESFTLQYEEDQRFGHIFAGFALLALFVACLGLLGLSTLMAYQKRKEIGIRKILGASILHILSLLTKGYLSMITISVLLGAPIVFWGVQQWLDNYAFRMEFSIWLYLIPAVLLILIALFAVSWQTLRAAQANPIDALREE